MKIAMSIACAAMVAATAISFTKGNVSEGVAFLGFGIGYFGLAMLYGGV